MDSETWNKTIEALPGAHILQTWEWGQLKASYGWEPLPQIWRDDAGQVQAAALVLQRTIRPAGLAAQLRILYVPRGPMMDWSDNHLRERVLNDLQLFARKQGAIFIKMDPDLPVGVGIPGQPEAQDQRVGQQAQTEFAQRGWKFSDDQIQFRNTVWIDLNGTEADWLARMKQKTRYNLRLAEKKGVVVRAGSSSDLPFLYKMYAETSVRDGFVIRPESYYLKVWQTFMDANMAVPLIAEADGEIVAAVMVFMLAQKAWYLYGMSRQLHREKMPNYLLQWEAMRLAKSRGCVMYDLWGAPDEFNETDSMWGVFRFKEGLGGQVVRTAGAWDYTPRPWLYNIYTQLLPRLLDVMRRRGRDKTKREVAL